MDKLISKVLHLEHGMITDQMISDSWSHMTNKVWDEKTKSMMTVRSRKQIESVLWTLLESESSHTHDWMQGTSDTLNMNGIVTSSPRNKSKPWTNHWKQCLNNVKRGILCSSLLSMAILLRSTCSMWLTPQRIWSYLLSHDNNKVYMKLFNVKCKSKDFNIQVMTKTRSCRYDFLIKRTKKRFIHWIWWSMGRTM